MGQSDTAAKVAGHYGLEGLEDRIFDAMAASGLDLEALTPEDLAPIDEFHMGGRAATVHIVGLMNLSPGMEVLDIGSGLGGLTRYLAAEAGCRATGIDLTPDYEHLAQRLTGLTGLSDTACFQTASALDLPFADHSFDAATTFHVAMNIADRPKMYAEAARVLRPGSVFAVYDVMKGPADGMQFPVPWADTAGTSHLETPGAMQHLLNDAGFDIEYVEDRTSLISAPHKARMAAAATGAGKSPLGIHLLQGDTAKQKSQNMIAMAEAGQIVLVIMIARRR